MRAAKILHCVDSHTGGEPTRLVVAGIPPLRGSTVSEQRDDLRERHDWIRRVTVQEPRGHRGMFAAGLVEPADPSCDWGVVFFAADGYPDMCGHAVIGIGVTLVELGMLSTDRDVDTRLETPAGPISITVHADGRGARGVTFVNQPAYWLTGVPVPVPDGTEVTVDVAYGGRWYAFVPAAAWSLRVRPADLSALLNLAPSVREAVNARLATVDPRTGEVPVVENVVWFDEPDSPGANGRNVAISSAGAFDRSPCGTATSARLAVEHAHGRLQPGEVYVNQSILGTSFRGRIERTVDVNGRPAVVPAVTGEAWLTGSSQLWVHPEDPLKDGFLLDATG